MGLFRGLLWSPVWGGSPYSVLRNINFSMHRAPSWVPKKMRSVTQHHIFYDNSKTGCKIQKLSINIEQHLLNAADSIFLHSTGKLKVRMISSGSICNRDQKKGDSEFCLKTQILKIQIILIKIQRILLKDIDKISNCWLFVYVDNGWLDWSFLKVKEPVKSNAAPSSFSWSSMNGKVWRPLLEI